LGTVCDRTFVGGEIAGEEMWVAVQ
jgi:hypothetical protein